MNLTVDRYTIHNLTQNELDLIYAALCQFPIDNPRSGEIFLLKEKFRKYQSTFLANGERDKSE